MGQQTEVLITKAKNSKILIVNTCGLAVNEEITDCVGVKIICLSKAAATN